MICMVYSSGEHARVKIDNERAMGSSGPADIVLRAVSCLSRYTNPSKGGEEAVRQLTGIRVAAAK